MSLTDLLAQLKDEYLSSISVKIELLGRLWTEKNLSDLETEFHKMKGTGRTYGLPEISQLGEAMEKICETNPSVLDQAVPISQALLARVQLCRKQGSPFRIDQDPEFLVLMHYAGPLVLSPSRES